MKNSDTTSENDSDEILLPFFPGPRRTGLLEFWRSREGAGTSHSVGRLVTCYDGNETVFWRKHEGREISAFADPIEQSTRRSGAERGASADDYLSGSPPGFLIRRSLRWSGPTPELFPKSPASVF